VSLQEELTSIQVRISQIESEMQTPQNEREAVEVLESRVLAMNGRLEKELNSLEHEKSADEMEAKLHAINDDVRTQLKIAAEELNKSRTASETSLSTQISSDPLKSPQIHANLMNDTSTPVSSPQLSHSTEACAKLKDDTSNDEEHIKDQRNTNSILQSQLCDRDEITLGLQDKVTKQDTKIVGLLDKIGTLNGSVFVLQSQISELNDKNELADDSTKTGRLTFQRSPHDEQLAGRIASLVGTAEDVKFVKQLLEEVMQERMSLKQQNARFSQTNRGQVNFDTNSEGCGLMRIPESLKNGVELLSAKLAKLKTLNNDLTLLFGEQHAEHQRSKLSANMTCGMLQKEPGTLRSANEKSTNELMKQMASESQTSQSHGGKTFQFIGSGWGFRASSRLLPWKVTQVVVGSQAQSHGVQMGWRVTHADGVLINKDNAGEIWQQFTAGGDHSVTFQIPAAPSAIIGSEAGKEFNKLREYMKRYNVELALDNMESLTQLGISGVSPLHVAASKGLSKAVKYMLACLKKTGRSDMIDLQTKSRAWTPLHAAAYYNRAECVRLLVDAGAQTKLRSTKGETPGCLAEARKNTNLFRMLNYSSLTRGD